MAEEHMDPRGELASASFLDQSHFFGEGQEDFIKNNEVSMRFH